MKTNSLLVLIRELWKILGKKRTHQFFFLFLLMLLSAVSEIISIGSIVPFLSALTNPHYLFNSNWFQPVLDFFVISTHDELLLFLTVVFVGAAIFSGLIRISLLWFNTRLCAAMGVQLRSEVYSRTLYMPYEYHTSQNSSDLISMTTEKVGLSIQAGVLHVLMILNALVSSLAITTILVFINPLVALITFLILGLGYLLIGKWVRSYIKMNGVEIGVNQPKAVKFLQEGLGGIRDILLDNSQRVFIDQYSQVARKIQYSEMKNTFLGNLPKSLLEVLSISFIALLAYLMLSEGTSNELVFPTLGALALGAQRLLPALQQVYFSWSIIHAYQYILVEVVKQLKKPFFYHRESSQPISKMPFQNEVTISGVLFKYNSSNQFILKGIDLTIKKGQKIGFVGSTGSGKSTLLDIIMGLLSPTTGSLKVDGVEINEENLINWQSNISHVPQNIYLSDATFLENIAFGVPVDKINKSKVKQVSKQVFINDFIENLEDGYQTKVGERGIQLSGGQKQRIGLARALYKESNVIILDEATSSLDDKTERKVINTINSLDSKLTILMIAHRISTLQECDVIYHISDGQIIHAGTYKELFD